MPTDVMITGRLVGGHPMVMSVVKDDKTNLPKLQKDKVTVRTSAYIGVAVPKGIEPDFKLTEFGKVFLAEAQVGWKNGQWQHPTFAWKVTDGDSVIPNKKGKIPNQREGYAGHWVIHCSTEIPVKCYHINKYDPTQQIQSKDEIKTGDYCRVVLTVKPNDSDQSPGLYVNPILFELSRAGQQIVTGDGPDAAAAFGGSAPVLPPNGAYDTAVAPPAGPGVPPAPGLVAPPAPAEPKYLVNGVEYTLSALKAANWTDAQIAAATPVGASPPVPIAPPTAPAPDFLTPPAAPVAPPAEERYFVQGKVYTKSQLVGFGWTAAQIAAAPPYMGDDVPL